MLALTGLPNFTGQSPFQISATLMSINQTQPKSLIPRQKNGGQIATMLDDCISAIQACAEGYLAHNLSASDKE